MQTNNSHTHFKQWLCCVKLWCEGAQKDSRWNKSAKGPLVYSAVQRQFIKVAGEWFYLQHQNGNKGICQCNYMQWVVP